MCSKETFDAKQDAPTSFLRLNIDARTEHNQLPVKLNLVEEPIWPEAGGAPNAQHTCPALIEIKWMSEGWMALTELWNSREVQSHIHRPCLCKCVWESLMWAVKCLLQWTAHLPSLNKSQRAAKPATLLLFFQQRSVHTDRASLY